MIFATSSEAAQCMKGTVPELDAAVLLFGGETPPPLGVFSTLTWCMSAPESLVFSSGSFWQDEWFCP